MNMYTLNDSRDGFVFRIDPDFRHESLIVSGYSHIIGDYSQKRFKKIQHLMSRWNW